MSQEIGDTNYITQTKEKSKSPNASKKSSRQIKNYSQHDLECAIQLYLDGTEMRIVRLRYPAVPERTIYGRAALKRNHKKVKKPGPAPALSPSQEDELVAWIVSEQAKGRRITRDIVCAQANIILRSSRKSRNSSTALDITTAEDTNSSGNSDKSPSSTQYLSSNDQSDFKSTPQLNETSSADQGTEKRLREQVEIQLLSQGRTPQDNNQHQPNLGFGWLNRFMQRHPQLLFQRVRKSDGMQSQKGASPQQNNYRMDEALGQGSSDNSIHDGSNANDIADSDSYSSNQSAMRSFHAFNEEHGTSNAQAMYAHSLASHTNIDDTTNGRRYASKRKNDDRSPDSQSGSDDSPRTRASSDTGEDVSNEGISTTAKYRSISHLNSNSYAANPNSLQSIDQQASFLSRPLSARSHTLPSNYTQWTPATTNNVSNSSFHNPNNLPRYEHNNITSMMHQHPYNRTDYEQTYRDATKRYLELEKLRCEIDMSHIRLTVERVLARKTLIEAGISASEADEILLKGSYPHHTPRNDEQFR